MNIRSAQEQSIADTVVNQVETQVLRALRETEDKLDEELRQLEQVSDDDLERLRERRLRELKAEAREREELLELGHGTYVEIDEKDFFSAAKRSRYMVIHFYRPTTRRCQIVDSHLQALSRKYVTTRFAKINAEKAPFLADRLRIRVIPTIVLIKDGETLRSLVGFDAFGGVDTFPTSVVETVLKDVSVIGKHIGSSLRQKITSQS